MVTTCCLPLASRIMHISCTGPCAAEGSLVLAGPGEPIEPVIPVFGFMPFRGPGACRESSSGQLVLSPNAEVDELEVVKPAFTTGCDAFRVSLPDANAAPEVGALFVVRFANELAAARVGWKR